MKDIREKKVLAVNGLLMAAIDLVIFFFCARYVVAHADLVRPGSGMIVSVLGSILVFMTFGGFFLIHPNESKVFTFLGKYIGSAQNAGFFWTNPFVVKKKVTLRIFNFNSETIKVNDALVKLDEEKKAAMVNNLLVALVSETEMHPIVNTGTLYS